MSITSPSAETVSAETVWRDFGGSLQAFVRRRIADPDRAEDVVGEVLLRIHRSLHTLEDPQRVTAWVLQIARNAIIDEYRRRPWDSAGLHGKDDVLPPAPSAEAWIDDQAAVLDDLAACMRPLLAQLPDPYRRALDLTDLQRTQADAARVEGLSVSGMKSRVQRGRRMLAELLQRCCALSLDARGLPLDHHRPDGCSCG